MLAIAFILAIVELAGWLSPLLPAGVGMVVLLLLLLILILIPIHPLPSPSPSHSLHLVPTHYILCRYILK